MLGLLHCFNGCEGERNWLGIHRSVIRRAGDVVGSSFFLGAVTLSNAVDHSRKVATYGDYPQEAYEWHTWTGAGSVHLMSIRFFLYGVH
jgi:hypothetical protein